MGKQPTEQGYALWWSSRCKAAEGHFNVSAAMLISLQPPRMQAGSRFELQKAQRSQQLMKAGNPQHTHKEEVNDTLQALIDVKIKAAL
uniref:Uncharacterized protein n=1 Tax=Romanomermis culicivorax TaxID=13658 RepID=A0A915HVE4_ROMCU